MINTILCNIVVTWDIICHLSWALVDTALLRNVHPGNYFLIS
jgi:hypothetical protein